MGVTRHGQAGHGRAGHGRAWHGKAWLGEAGQGKAWPGRAWQGVAGMDERATSSQVGPDFKIDNRFTSRYARKLIAEYPEFADFFELRKLKTT